MIPANNDEIVLSSKCENSDSSIQKEHLLFSFIPSKFTDIYNISGWYVNNCWFNMLHIACKALYGDILRPYILSWNTSSV